MFPDLRSFLDALAREGELARVDAPVSPILEIAQIADVESKSRAPSLPSASARRNDPRFCDRGGRALLFTNVEGSEMPVAINVMGSYRRMEMALGCAEGSAGIQGGFDAIAARIGELVKPEFPRSIGEAFRKARSMLPLLSIGPRRRRGMGLCQEIVHTEGAIDLRRLPIIRCWPEDGDPAAVGYPAGLNDGVEGVASGDAWEKNFRGRYITLAGIHTIHADDAGNPKPASHNIGMYRVQLLGKDRVAMHWHIHHDGARHWRSWKAKGEPMPVAIVLGGPSVLPYAATSPLPPGISELLMAGFLSSYSGGRGLEMVMGRTVPIWVPAHAEIVIEGYVSHEAGQIGWLPGKLLAASSKQLAAQNGMGPGAVLEGPFGDHTGFYSMPDRYPVVKVTGVTHRRDPIYPTTIVGLPPQEDYYIGKATERIFLPLLKTVVHDIEDYDLPMFGAFHNAAMVKIRKSYGLQGRRVMHSVWGAGQMAWTKSIFVVDDDVDVHDTTAVLRAAARWCTPARDTEMTRGPLDILDHAAPAVGVGTKMGFDCTRKQIEELDTDETLDDRHAAAEVIASDAREILHRVRSVPGILHAALPESCGHGWLFASIRKMKAGDGTRAVAAVLEAIHGIRTGAAYVVILDGTVDVSNVDQAMFHWCSNCDVGRDTQEAKDSTGRVIRLGFDATAKIPGDERNGKSVRPWPPILSMREEIVQRVRGRWQEYGLGSVSPQSA
jgi:4-hydroxy-3-polyprenylbenzoate decarboxylase